jgi:hypothetical protein
MVITNKVNNNIEYDEDNCIIVNEKEFDKYIYNKIFTDTKKKIINTSNNNFMKNLIDKSILKNKVNTKYMNNND